MKANDLISNSPFEYQFKQLGLNTDYLQQQLSCLKTKYQTSRQQRVLIDKLFSLLSSQTNQKSSISYASLSFQQKLEAIIKLTLLKIKYLQQHHQKKMCFLKKLFNEDIYKIVTIYCLKDKNSKYTDVFRYKNSDKKRDQRKKGVDTDQYGLEIYQNDKFVNSQGLFKEFISISWTNVSYLKMHYAYMTAQQLIEIVKNLQQKFPILTNLDLSYNLIASFDQKKVFNSENCNISHMDISNSVQNINQPELSCKRIYQKYSSIEKIKLSCNFMGYISQLSYFSLIQEINLYKNKLSNIDDFAKGTYPNLVSLNMSQNQIVVLPALNTVNLVELQADNNKLKSIGPFLTKSYPNLKKIALKNNCLKMIQRIKMEKLQQLNLVNNVIQQIDQYAFEQCQNLKILKLNLNRIRKLPQLNLKNLTSLSIEENLLDCINNIKKTKFQKLQFINLTQNRIKKLPKMNVFSLDGLHYAKNPIHNIDNLIKSYSNQKYKDEAYDFFVRQLRVKFKKMSGVKSQLFFFNEWQYQQQNESNSSNHNQQIQFDINQLVNQDLNNHNNVDEQ